MIEEKLRAHGNTEDEIVKRLEEIKNTVRRPVYVEGTPGENDIKAEDAVEIAKSVIKEKYALTDETLDRFSVYTGFNVADPEHPAWHINLQPGNPVGFR